jgi:hypothetical protein
VDCRLAVCLLLFANLASAAELSMSGELHYNSVEVTLQNTAAREVSFALKVQLKQKASDWVTIETPCLINDSLNSSESRTYNCSYATPSEPGEYKVFARADILNGTYTYKNFLFSIEDSGFKETGPVKDVMVEITSSPAKVKTGENFSVSASVTSNIHATLEIYSYVYDGKTCYSFYGWKGNAEKYDFAAGETKTINLMDIVRHEAGNGTYTLKVRARLGSGDSAKDYDASAAIEVEQAPVDLFQDLPKQKKVSGKPDGTPLNLLLPILGSIPLLLVLVKKAL